MDRKRILFVDDDPLLLQGLQRMLRPMRDTWDMAFAHGSLKALEMMKEFPADVVVSDMRMPEMNGAELLREIMNQWPSTVRLVLSGHADRELVAQCVGVAHQYISKPCDPELLKTMIQNAMLLSNNLVSGNVKRIIGSIDALPSIPAVYSELQEALEDEQVTLPQIGDILQKDIGMTAKLLKLVNSAFFGLRRTITSPQEAVVYLGAETIKVLVLANSIFTQAKPIEAKLFHADDLWNHSLGVANTARAIARHEKSSKTLQEEAFVGGILHDAGVLILASKFAGEYDEVLRRVAEQGESLPQAETREFGVTHAEVGAYLLGLWGLPPSVLQIISFHHQPILAAEGAFSSLLAVHAADYMDGKKGLHPMFKTLPLAEEALNQAGLAGRIQEWEALGFGTK